MLQVSIVHEEQGRSLTQGSSVELSLAPDHVYGHLHVYSGHFSYTVCLNIYALRLVDHAVFHQYAWFWVLPSDLKPNNGGKYIYGGDRLQDTICMCTLTVNSSLTLFTETVSIMHFPSQIISSYHVHCNCHGSYPSKSWTEIEPSEMCSLCTQVIYSHIFLG